MIDQRSRRWFTVPRSIGLRFVVPAFLVCLLAPVSVLSAQETGKPSNLAVDEARVHVAGPNLLFLDGVRIEGTPYAVYLSADNRGQWRVTSLEAIDRRAVPRDVYLDQAKLSVSSSGELHIDNIQLDGQFYSGTVSFDPSYRRIRRYHFAATAPPHSVLQRLDEYARHGAQRLDLLEARLDDITQQMEGVADRGMDLGPDRGADDISPTLSLARARAEMSSIETLDLSIGTPVSGSWRATGSSSVSQVDPDARFAKLTLPYRQDSRPRLYRVLTRAVGRGWAGVGIHLGVTDVELPAGYGHGRSILVWLTRDARVYGSESTFLEVYVSYDDVTMNRVAQSALNVDLSTTSALEVLIDPAVGMVTIAVDGVEQFRYRLSLSRGAGLEVALRALGAGEFSDLEVRRR